MARNYLYLTIAFLIYGCSNEIDYSTTLYEYHRYKIDTLSAQAFVVLAADSVIITKTINNRTFTWSYGRQDSGYQFTSKEYFLDGKKYTVTRIDNSKHRGTPSDGRTYTFYDNLSRLLIERSLDWPSYKEVWVYDHDQRLQDLILSDTSCFYKCPKPQAPVPPPSPSFE